MIDDCIISCKSEQTARNIFNIIGEKMQFPSEKEKGIISFEFLGVVNDYNGVDIKQTSHYIEMSCQNYINCLCQSYGWDVKTTLQEEELASEIHSLFDISSLQIQERKQDRLPNTSMYFASRRTVPMPSDYIKKMYKETGPKEHTPNHKILETKRGFSYCTLLGEAMFAYITCQPDIGYAVTTLSKFSCAPSEYHYKLLKLVARYLCTTSHWGIRFKCSILMTLTEEDYRNGFFPTTSYDIQEDPNLKELFSIPINTNKLIGFCDALHANNLRKRRSTTGIAFTFMGGAVVYKSKTQSITVGSSTESEFIAAHSAAKIARYLRMLLKQVGYEQKEPTPIYIDNLLTLKMIHDNTSPTDWTRHIDIRYFAIQDWRLNGDIIMVHIKGILNISDAETKPLGYVLHSQHYQQMMGHYD